MIPECNRGLSRKGKGGKGGHHGHHGHHGGGGHGGGGGHHHPGGKTCSGTKGIHSSCIRTYYYKLSFDAKCASVLVLVVL